MNKVVLSLGGSVIVPKEINVNFLKKFKKLILSYIKDYQFFIFTGGGKICREYQEAAKAISYLTHQDLDWLGIYASRFNAQLLRYIFKQESFHKIITNPNYAKRIKHRIVIGAGWKPGWSTDYDAVTLAIKQKVKTVVNLSNIEYVYSRDPKKYKNAQKIKQIKWSEFRKIVGNRWNPGLNMPFDPIAAKLAQKCNVKVIIMKGTNLTNLKQFLSDKPFKGTAIY